MVLLTLGSTPGFCHEHALILYVYLPNDDESAEESVLTVGPLSKLPSVRMKSPDQWFSTISALTAHK